MNNKFLKIKIKDSIVFLEWLSPRQDNTFDSFSLRSADIPAASFINLFFDLRKFVNDICDLRLADDELHLLTITSLTFSFTSPKDVMGCTITAARTLPNCLTPFNINTPHLFSDYFSDTGDPRALLPSKLVLLLDEIQSAANDYVGGFRKQLNLFESKTISLVE